MIDKKEIKRAYKETVQPMGVCLVTNRANGKVFVFGSRNLQASINSNRFQLKIGSHFNKELQKEYSQYGEAAFSFCLHPEDQGPDR